MAIKNITVIGSGLMGRGIAQVSAQGGYKTIMVDISEAILNKAMDNIRAETEKGVSLGKLSAEARERTLANLTTGTDLEKAGTNADVIIEAVPEDMKLKYDTFTRLDRTCPAHTLFASNTSSLSITEMAASTKRARNFLGMHFFNPVHKMKLLEIVKGLETSPEAIAIASEVGKQMGKEVVVIKETPASSM